jgi:hypothetical protein
MQDVVGILIAVLFALVCGTTLLAAFEQRRFYAHLRDKHIRRWIDLGAPDAFNLGVFSRTVNSPGAQFIARREYMELDDVELQSLGDRARWMAQLARWEICALVAACTALAVVS